MLYNGNYIEEGIMPPKAKITREMIVDTAFEIVRKEGADKVTARSISEQLSCSTQPVLYYFSTVEDIKKAFQSNEFSGVSMLELLETEELFPMLGMLQNELDISMEAAKEVFTTLFIFSHGYASLYANNTMLYNEQDVIRALDKIFEGAVCTVKRD